MIIEAKPVKVDTKPGPLVAQGDKQGVLYTIHKTPAGLVVYRGRSGFEIDCAKLAAEIQKGEADELVKAKPYGSELTDLGGGLKLSPNGGAFIAGAFALTPNDLIASVA